MGVVLTSVIVLTGMVQWGMRQSAEMENLMTSTERVLEYGKIESEAELESDEAEKNQLRNWPSEGVVDFQSVWLKYGKEEKYVLKGVDFKSKPNEKVAILLFCNGRRKNLSFSSADWHRRSDGSRKVFPNCCPLPTDRTGGQHRN